MVVYLSPLTSSTTTSSTPSWSATVPVPPSDKWTAVYLVAGYGNACLVSSDGRCFWCAAGGRRGCNPVVGQAALAVGRLRTAVNKGNIKRSAAKAREWWEEMDPGEVWETVEGAVKETVVEGAREAWKVAEEAWDWINGEDEL